MSIHLTVCLNWRPAVWMCPRITNATDFSLSHTNSSLIVPVLFQRPLSFKGLWVVQGAKPVRTESSPVLLLLFVNLLQGTLDQWGSLNPSGEDTGGKDIFLFLSVAQVVTSVLQGTRYFQNCVESIKKIIVFPRLGRVEDGEDGGGMAKWGRLPPETVRFAACVKAQSARD